MNTILVDLLVFLLLFVLIWGIRFTKEENFMSQSSVKKIKGVLAIIIMFHHLAQRIPSGLLFRHFYHMGSIVVALFFFYSGYGLQKKQILDNNYKNRILSHRLPAILLPYIIVTAIYWIIYALSGTVYSLSGILLAICQGSPIVPFSWYLITLFTYYIAFYIFSSVFKQHYWGTVIGIFLYSLLWVSLCRTLNFDTYWYYTSYLVTIGTLWATLENIFPIFSQKTDLLSLFSIGICFFTIFSLTALHIILPAMSICIVILVVVTIMHILKLENIILNFLGNISFEIYLTHGILITLLRSDFLYIEEDYLWCYAIIGGTIIFSFILHKINQIIVSSYTSLFCKLHDVVSKTQQSKLDYNQN